MASCRQDGCSAALAGGYCLTRPVKDLGLDGDCGLHQKSQCFVWVADKEIIDRLLQTGALVLLPGWLADWESHIEARWPGDPKAAQAYFREVAKRAVLLDTGVHPGIDRELKAFTRFLRLSGEVHPAGMDPFRLNLARVVLSWRMERQAEDNEDRVSVARQNASGFSRIVQLLGVVTLLYLFEVMMP